MPEEVFCLRFVDPDRTLAQMGAIDKLVQALPLLLDYPVLIKRMTYIHEPAPYMFNFHLCRVDILLEGPAEVLASMREIEGLPPSQDFTQQRRGIRSAGHGGVGASH